MKKYDKYKESNIEWLGEIPEHWKNFRLGNIGNFLKGKGVSKADLSPEGLPVLLYGDIYTKYNIQTDRFFRKFPDKIKQKSVEVKNGDLLFTASGETRPEIGKCICYLGTEKAYASGDVIIYRQNVINPLFLSYLFNSYKINEQKAKLSKGEIVVHIYSSQLRSIYFPLPPLIEQTAIAAYLDKKTAEIDELIADKKRLVQLYEEEKKGIINQAVTKGLNPDAPMKDSGIDWLGEIPAHWEISRMKNICKVRQGLQIAIEKRHLSKVENSLEYITIRSIHNPNQAKEYIQNPPKNVICNSDDILMARTGATGETITNVNGVFHNNFFLIDYNKQLVNKMFLFYYLKSTKIKEYLLLVAGTTTIPDLNHGSFYNTPFLIFSLKEQQYIIKQVKLESEIIERKIRDIKKQIELLTEYRTTLISEVVTGKIKVI